MYVCTAGLKMGNVSRAHEAVQ